MYINVRIMGVGRVWDGMLFPSVTEEGGNGEGVGTEVPSLLSCTFRYVSLTELVTVRLSYEYRYTCVYSVYVSKESEDGDILFIIRGFLLRRVFFVYYESIKRELQRRLRGCFADESINFF